MTHSVGGEHVTEAQPISAAETVTDRGLPAASGHASPTVLRLLGLQQAIGNHAVSRLLQRNGGTPGGPAGAPAPTDATMLEVESGVGKEGEIEQKDRGAPLEAKDNGKGEVVLDAPEVVSNASVKFTAAGAPPPVRRVDVGYIQTVISSDRVG